MEKKLVEYMFEYDVGVSKTTEYKIKDIDDEYFIDDQYNEGK